MTSVANNFSIFSINRKQTNKQTKTDNFSSFVLMKNRTFTFTNKEKKNLIHFRLTTFVRRFTQGRWRRGMGTAGGDPLGLGMRT